MLARLLVVAGLVTLGFITFFVLALPRSIEVTALPVGYTPDLENGETLFWAGGCSSCHAAPDSENEARLILGGGVELSAPFGVFRAPNISADSTYGIGDWRTIDFVNSMRKGLSPDGRHYYPAFPYPNYQLMLLTDVIDLKAFLDTLPPSRNQVADHELAFPYNIRRGLWLWKLLYLDDQPFVSDSTVDTQIERGRYLVQGPGHCGACHTQRDRFGGEIAGRELAGAAELGLADDGEELNRVPNITPHKDGIGQWSKRDIAYSLETGFDPDFDTFSGSMVEVQENMAELTSADRDAIAAYLKFIQPLPSSVLETDTN